MNLEQYPTPEDLKKSFIYNPETGGIVRKINIVKGRSGQNAVFPHARGYLCIYFKDKTIKAHRAAFALFYGRYPKHQIDHINGNRSDNRISNLREATTYENSRNAKTRKDNKSGKKGVYFHKQSQKWTAQITHDNKIITIGRFADKEKAIEARLKSELELQKEFARP